MNTILSYFNIVKKDKGVLKLKVLLLSVKAGYGHHSTAKAIMEYFEENGHQCHMLDIFDYVNHRLGNSIQDGYLLSTKYLAKTYAKAYGKLIDFMNLIDYNVISY